MSICGLPSAAGLALENVIVQRASVSFWRALAGFSGQVSPAFSLALIGAFSASGLRWRGAATQRGVDDLARHRQIAGLGDRPVEPREQRVPRARRDQGLAEIPQRIRIRHRVARPEAAKPHPAQPVGHQELRLRQRQPAHRLQHEHPELRHRLKRRTDRVASPAPRASGNNQ